MTKLLSILLSVVSLSAATRITRHATDFTLTLPEWDFITDADTLEGSWRGLLTLQPDVTATIPLGQTLTSGTYAVGFKVLDYDQSHSFTFTAGSYTSSPDTFNDRDTDTIYWMPLAPFTSASSFSEVVLTITGAALRDCRLMAMYITTDTNDFVFRDDRRLTFDFPTAGEIDSSAAISGNLVPNGSFELGVGPFWRMLSANGATRTNYLADLWSSAQAYHGSYSLRLPVYATGNIFVSSNPLEFRSTNKVHTASVRVKSPTVATTCNIYVTSFYDSPDGYDPTHAFVGSTLVNPADGWKLLSVAFTNYYFPNGQYYVSILNQASGGATDIYVDALQVHEGTTIPTFAPQHSFEFEPVASHISKVLYTSESPYITLRHYNNLAAFQTKTIAYEARNWTNGQVFSNTVTVTASPSVGGSTTISLPTNQLGHFRFSAWLTNQQSDTELAYLLINPPTAGFSTNSGFGNHIDHSLASLGVANRLGIKQQVGVSTARVRWSEIEESDGVFDPYPDLQYFNSNDIVVTINLLEESPSWVTNNIVLMTNGGKWQRWVTNTVAHYKTRLTHRRYEIANEPDQGSQYLPGADALERLTNYASLVATAVPLIKSYDPDAAVIAGGGILSADHVAAFWNQLSAPVKAQIDYISVHIYPGNEVVAPTLKTNVAIAYGKEVINTESGITDKGSYAGARAPFRTAGEYVIDYKSGDYIYDTFYNTSLDISKNFLTCMAYGINYNAYYDLGARNIEPDDFESRQFTMLEYDDGVRVKGGALVTIFQHLDKATGYGSVSPDARLSAYLYSNNGVSYAALWGTSNLTATLSGITTSDIKVIDLMGNSGNPASLGLPILKLPQLIQGQGGLALNTLSNAILGASVSGRADTQAPILSLTAVPRGLLGFNHFRWFAWDDSGMPNESSMQQIEYRYSFDGGTNYSAWGGHVWTDVTNQQITVQARDLAGNSTVVTWPDGAGPVDPEPEPEPAPTTGGTTISGRTILRAVNLRTL